MCKARSRSLCLLLAPWILLAPLPSMAPRSVVPRGMPVVRHEPPSAAHGGGPWSRIRKPLHQVVACFGLLLGVTGVFLAFATGPLVPLAFWAVAGVAWQVCGG